MTEQHNDAPASRLTTLVNASGFAFQLGVEDAIARTEGVHGWQVVSREHAWITGARSGFADLVLSKGLVRLVVECKRVRNADWVFLVPADQAPVAKLKLQWADSEPERRNLVGYFSINAAPATAEAEFCIVRGTGEGDKPLLERVAWQLVESLPALAEQELELPESAVNGAMLVHVPLIVTNACLHLCRYDPQHIDLVTGDIAHATYEPVSYLRFRKSLTHEPGRLDYRRNLREEAGNKERSVLVTTAQSLPDLLAQLTLSVPDEPKWPGTWWRRKMNL